MKRTPLLALLLIPFALACGDVGSIPPGGGGGPGGGAGPDAGPAASPRVTAGLQAIYLFNEGSGSTIYDQSLLGGLDLQVEDPASVQWMPTGGLNVTAPTLLATVGPADRLGNSCMASNAVTVEAWVRPAAVNQSGPARIVTLSDGNNSRNFTLAQDNLLLDVRARTTDTDDSGGTTVSDVTAFGANVVHLAYTRSGVDDEAQLWVDGQLAGTETLAGSFSNWDMTYRLGVANELNGERPWRGEIYLVAVYCRSLSPGEIWQNYKAGY